MAAPSTLAAHSHVRNTTVKEGTPKKAVSLKHEAAVGRKGVGVVKAA